ncbi:hypothetical protein [Lutibacter citreus]|uniref:hypothetical protein n=1 Tax=Lutibacter citreus TaxID=2138210 RepID=UPI000DBEA9C1|nr:hypothetical protein [Lutibacter citreus]
MKRIIKYLSVLFLVVLFFSCSKKLNITKTQNDKVKTELESVLLSTNKGEFYTLPTSFKKTVNFKTEYNVDNDFSTDDSEKLQKAIDKLSDAGGGKIVIPEGNYSFNEVSLKKDVHIEIDKDAVLRPFAALGKKALLMFSFTSTNKNVPLRNTGIYCTNGKFTVDLNYVRPLGRGFRFCIFKNADGFLVSDVSILDNHTQFSAFVFNGETINNRAYGPKNGVLKNANTTNSDYGYGLIQMQLGKNIFYSNISGIGGATLRLEPHNKNLRTLDAVNVIDNIVARNVRCTEGNAAIMLSPHFMANGIVDLRDITSVRCGAAVRIEGGFISKDEKAYGITSIGSFDSRSIIRDVKVTYAETGAQVKPKHYRYLPCNLKGLTTKNVLSEFLHGDSFEGPSIAGVIYTSKYSIDFNESHVTKFEGPNNGLQKVVRAVVKCN